MEELKLVDTVYLVAYINPQDKLYSKAREIFENMGSHTFISSYALLELDLIMKSRGFTVEERIDAWTILESKIAENVAHPHPQDHRLATELQGLDYDYFDSLIAAQAARLQAKPLTKDAKLIEAYNKITEKISR
jgi:predicted nucleic-acid-binding protein